MFRFPKNCKYHKQWAIKSKRMDNWNPGLLHICTDNFSENYCPVFKIELLSNYCLSL